MGTSKKRIQYRYDAAGNRTLMIDPDGGRFTYAYDNMNRISHLVNPQGDRTTYSYDANGRRTVTKLANGTRASFTYDDANRLTTLGNLKSDGTVLSQFDYGYDKAGNRTWVLEADGSRVTYSYDRTYQLTAEHRTGTTPYRSTFTYDSAGNRTLKNETGARTTYAYDAANQLTYAQDGTGRTTYTFDADGNQQLVVSPTGGRITTTWDYENKTTLVQLPSGIRNTMAYDTEGLRMKLEESSGTKKFVWDDQNYLGETDASNDTQVVYTNEPQVYGNLISHYRKTSGIWVPSYYHYDALGSTRQLTDSGQAVTDAYLYDAWGYVLTSTGTTVNPFQYVGHLGYYFDTDTGNYYIRARIYLPVVARWMSIDPAGQLDADNMFLYSLNDPFLSDASGYACSPAMNGVKYVPGRGSLTLNVFEYVAPTWYERSYNYTGSSMSTTWSFKKSMFCQTSTGACKSTRVCPESSLCCCCDKVGFIQKVHYVVRKGKRSKSKKQVDAGIPYPNGPIPSVNPCETQLPPKFLPSRIQIEDTPGYALGSFTLLIQHFELCAVCLSGCEGPDATNNSIVVYGCETWAHIITNRKGKVIWDRYIGSNRKTSTTAPHGKGASLTISTAKAPTLEWQDIVLQYMKK